MKTPAAICIAAMLLATAVVAAAEEKPSVRWSAKDVLGRDISVPFADKPAVVVFLRPGQQQSDDAIDQIKAVLAKQPSAQVVLVFSGPDNAAAGHNYAAARLITWPVILDPEYAISGKMNIHVWPSTTVVGTDGAEMARLTSLPSSYAADLHAHLDFAARQIDQKGLDRRLSTRQVVAATSQQAATRYVIIANALLERGQVDQALAEIEQGLTRDPSDVSLRLTRARILLKQKQFAAALAAADQLAGAAPPWQIQVLRAEALVAMERWPDAKAAAVEAVKLNPNPSHAHYLAGMVCAHEEDWKGAADSFRRAYESAASIRDARATPASR